APCFCLLRECKFRPGAVALARGSVQATPRTNLVHPFGCDLGVVTTPAGVQPTAQVVNVVLVVRTGRASGKLLGPRGDRLNVIEAVEELAVLIGEAVGTQCALHVQVALDVGLSLSDLRHSGVDVLLGLGLAELLLGLAERGAVTRRLLACLRKLLLSPLGELRLRGLVLLLLGLLLLVGLLRLLGALLLRDLSARLLVLGGGRVGRAISHWSSWDSWLFHLPPLGSRPGWS